MVGIIGGADGPTAIYVTSSFSSVHLLAILFGLVLLCGTFWGGKKLWKACRKKRNGE